MQWFKDYAPECDVVVSTRIRLARNLSDLPFPSHISSPEEINKVHQGAKESILVSPEFEYTHLADLSELDRRVLIEGHIISGELDKKGGLICNKDKSVSVMILEEDHYRLQSLGSGLSLKTTYDLADKLDNMLGNGVEYAFDDQLGFLSSCPTNVGTGLRASLMMHLPALTAAKGIQRISALVGKIGMTVRGAFGEGSAATGAFYQISNQITLGVSESEILSRLSSTAKKVIDFERGTRKELYTTLGIALEDKIWRAFGILKHARRINYAEAQKLISDVALGVSLGIVQGYTSGQLYRIMMDSGSATIAALSGRLKPQERDAARADMLRDIFV